MQMEKVEAIKTIIECCEIIQNNLNTISKSGEYIQSLKANNLTNDELNNKSDFFNKELMKLKEMQSTMHKFFVHLDKIAQENINRENKKIVRESNFSYLDLRDVEDCPSQKPINKFPGDNCSWFSMIEID